MYNDNKITDLVYANTAYHLLTEKLGIPVHDYSKTFAQVCFERNLNGKLVEILVRAYDDLSEFPYKDLDLLSIQELVQYLRTSHRYYLDKKLPELEQSAIGVFMQYSDTHPFLANLCLFFAHFKKKIESHIMYEEQNLFPYIDQLLKVHTNPVCKSEIHKIVNSFSASVFSQNHSDIEGELAKVRNVIVQNSLLNKQPLPYKIFLSQLYHFELELNKHAIIEDDILLKKIIRLETVLKQYIKGNNC